MRPVEPPTATLGLLVGRQITVVWMYPPLNESVVEVQPAAVGLGKIVIAPLSPPTWTVPPMIGTRPDPQVAEAPAPHPTGSRWE